MLAGIYRFELRYQVRRPWPWLMCAVMLVVCFAMTRDAAVQDALYEEFLVNSPFSIAITTVVGGLLWLLIAPVVAGEAAARDIATSMYPLVYTAPIRRSDHLLGRFLAALTLNALLLLAIQLGILLAVYAPGANAQLIGPFRPAAHLTAYAYISLPNAIVATVIQFAIALRSGRPFAAYIGSMILLFMGFFIASLLFYSRGAGMLLDPTGIRFIVEDVAHMWTTVERQTRLLELDAVVGRNRLVWLAAAAVVATYTYARFRFAHRTEQSRLSRFRRTSEAAPAPARIGITAAAPVVVPAVTPRFDYAMRVRQVLLIARTSFRSLARSRVGLAFLFGIPLLTIVVLIDQMSTYGSGLVPATGQVLKQLTAPITAELSRWVVVPLITVFFAGELVWREREAGLEEITDATAVPDWVPLLGKLLGLGFVLATFAACLLAAGMLAQLALGHLDFDIPLYLAGLFALQLPEYMLFAVLALAVHVVAGQKYVGHLAAIAVYVVILMAPTFGIEHDLLIYGAGPWWTFTEMRGVGPFIAPWLWFRLYWAAWALLLLVVARLLWMRGREDTFSARLRLARRRFTRGTARAAVLALALIVTFGGFVFYNTNVLNEYVTPSDAAEDRAQYERRYGRYADVPQPHISAAKLSIDIDPTRRLVEIRGSYTLVNRSDVPIDSIHVATLPVYETNALRFDRPARPVHEDDRLGHHIYALASPLLPGDSMSLDFEVRAERRGFREGGADVSIVPNGTLFTQHWLPAIGYQPMRELMLPSERRAQGLSERRVIPSLHDEDARSRRGPGIMLETVLSTDAGQVAVAPGALLRSWSEGGRSWHHYATDAPIGSEWSFTSARYDVYESKWNDVDIRIFHHPEHDTHPPRMAESIRKSLDYLRTNIGPYRYGHINVVEVPGDGVGMHAEASMLTHGEGVTFLRDEDAGLDMSFAVLAHEMAHQWAVPAAAVEGAPVIGEGVAWYYAIKVVEHMKGVDQLRRLMSYLRQPYPIAPIHRGEPLLRGLDPWMSYRKAPYALHALSEYVGEARVNEALRRLYERHRAEDAPLATTLDMYRELQAVTPDSLQYLLHDLFEVNTFWMFAVENVRAAPTPTGGWQVTMDVRARKVVIDSAGVETELPFDEWIPVGVFAAREPGRHELSAPLHYALHRIRSGRQPITITVADEPVIAGVDPYHLLDWEELEDDDNIEQVDKSDVDSR